MPQISVTVSPAGPIVDVLIGLSVPRQNALKAAGLAITVPINARLLVDTGASGTCLDETLVQALGLQPTSFQPIHTPSTNGAAIMMPQYDVSLIIPHPDIRRNFAALPVMASNFRVQNIDGLLGRDVLAGCVLILNGPEKTFTLAF